MNQDQDDTLNPKGTENQFDDVSSLHESDEGVSFGVSLDFRDSVQVALDNEDKNLILSLVSDLKAADVADLINHLEPRYRDDFVTITQSKLSPEVFVDVDPVLRQDLIRNLSPTRIAKILAKLDSDDAFNLLESINADIVHDVLHDLPTSDRAVFERVLQYPDKSAGRLMQREIVCVPEHWSVGQVIDFIRNHDEMTSSFYDIFVVDPRHHPIGSLSTNRLLRHKDNQPIRDIIDTDIQTFPDQADQEDVAQAFRHYGLFSAPVVSQSGRVVGMITVDDIVDVVQEEAEEDILHINKVKGESDFYAPVPTTAYWRTRWLLITLINSLVASYVIAQFEASIQQITALSFLMTINAAMGGNSGMQVVTVVVRALATKNLRDEDTWRAVRKEMSVSMLTGGFCAVLLGAVAAYWVNNYKLGIILSVSLCCNMLWAAFAGTLLPILVSRFKMDPAISAGPILTTTTDVFGYAIFLGMATYFLL